MANKKKTSRKHLKNIASFGAAMSTLAVAPHVQGAIIDLTPKLTPPGTNAYGGASFDGTLLSILGASTVFQFNDPVGKTLSAPGGTASASNSIVGFNFAQASSPINSYSIFDNYFNISASASGTQTFGFKTKIGQVGWIQMDLGGLGGDIIYLAAAMETGVEVSIHPPGTRIPEPSTTALLGLGMLAMGAGGVRRLRKRRNGETQPKA